jgi:hypothetical protein
MFKFLSFGNSRGGVLGTLLILIALGACYFFIYLPNNEKIVQERRFRCLRNIDTNLHTKMDNSVKQIGGLLGDYYLFSDRSNSRQINSLHQTDSLSILKNFIRTYPKVNFTLMMPEQANKYLNDSLVFINQDTASFRYYIDIGSQLTLLVKKGKIRRHYSGGKDITPDTTIGIQYQIDKFIKPLLPPDIFDNYIVFINDQKLYETFPSGLNYADADSLLNVRGKITTPGLRSLKIGGTSYKVFSHPIYTYTKDKWIIAGLVLDSNYQKERNQLPVWALLLLLITAAAMLVSLPWIKLYHMGNKDRLTTRDGIASLLVSMVLMSLLFFAFFKYRPSLIKEQLCYADFTSKCKTIYTRDDYSRNVLAARITDAFGKEIKETNNVLISFDKAHLGRQNTDADIYSLGMGRKKGAGTFFNRYDTLYRTSNVDIKQIFWLDMDGNEQRNFTVDPVNPPKSNYSSRTYFKKVKANYNDAAPKFYVDQIVSRTEGIFRSAIARKSVISNQVVGMTFTMQCLNKVIAPDGYLFAIIDNRGRVLYHSMPNRNLNENLKEEFADSSSLVSCLEAKSDTSFKAEYYGRQYNVKIMPIPGLPYFTVVFEDREYTDTRDMEAFTFTLSMMLCMIAFISIKYGIVFFVSSRRSYFKNELFDTSWIGPHKRGHHQYNLTIIVNLFIILLLIFFFTIIRRNSFLEYLSILLVSIVFTSLFLNCIFAIKYKYEEDFYKYQFKKSAIISLALFIILIDIAAFRVLSAAHIIVLYLYELFLILIYPLIFLFGKILLIRLRKFKNHFNWTFTHSYAFMVTTRLVITSGIPVAFFYIYSYDFEQNLDTRYRQLNFVTALAQKVNFKKGIAVNNKTLDSIKNNQDYTKGIYYDGMYIESIKDTNQRRKPSYHDEDRATTVVLGAFRYRSNNIEVRNNNLNLPSSGSNIFFDKITNEESGKKYTTYYKTDSSGFIKISSFSRINYQRPDPDFWIYLILSVFLFYYLIHHIIRKIFALDLSPTERWRKLDSVLLKSNDFTKLVLIVGSPGADTLSKLKYRINIGDIKTINGEQMTESNVFIADMSRIPADGKPNSNWNDCTYEALSGYPLVIINHFEYNICDPASNNMKLDLLESLMTKGDKVIIISTMHPLTFLDSFNDQQKKPISESEMGRWHMLLGNFRVMIDPLIASPNPGTQSQIEKSIIEETLYSRFLYRMRATILAFLQVNSETINRKTEAQVTDSLIFKLQLTSQYFYTDIWQSLTQEEKFILYDLAEDGLVNASDDFNVNMLICKGLIIRPDGPLRLFNKSFRNFILTAIGQKEMNRIKAQVKDNGNWKNLRVPMNLAILAILAFLLASQQEAYSRVIAYITALSGGIPVILKIFSMFGGTEVKKAE